MTATPPVSLVGAGPGPVGLLTRRAARRLAAADAVVLDREGLDHLAALAPPAAARLHVGLGRGRPAWPLDRVVERIAALWRDGRRVVRLKSGDPLVCSRGGEELAALTAAGVPVEVVPGVTAATAAPLAARLWLDPAAGPVVVASGDHDPGGRAPDWPTVGAAGAALVVLTGRRHHTAIAAGLVAGGRSPVETCAVVSAACRAGEAVAAVPLAQAGDVRLPAPAALVVPRSRRAPA